MLEVKTCKTVARRQVTETNYRTSSHLAIKSFLFRILQMSSVLNDFSTSSAQPYHFSRLSPFPIDIQARELL